MTTTTLAAVLNVSPQARAVFNHMRLRGSLCPTEARWVYGVESLSRRITELRHQGIETTTIRPRNPAAETAYALAS